MALVLAVDRARGHWRTLACFEDLSHGLSHERSGRLKADACVRLRTTDHAGFLGPECGSHALDCGSSLVRASGFKRVGDHSPWVVWQFHAEVVSVVPSGRGKAPSEGVEIVQSCGVLPLLAAVLQLLDESFDERDGRLARVPIVRHVQF
jgi:hypothetical protein